MTEKWWQLLGGVSDCSIENIRRKIAGRFDEYQIYERSVQKKNNTIFFIAKETKEKVLVLFGSEEYYQRFDGIAMNVNNINFKVCGLSHANCAQIRAFFPYTNPVGHGDRRFSLGLGDRLGVASAGHIRAVEDLDVFPVMAQQSMRELNLTGRTYETVLDDVIWAVFQEQYTKGFGADADHLKTREEIKIGIECGYSMVTLDCSEHIDNHFFDMEETQLRQDYGKLPAIKRQQLEHEYLSGRISIDERTMVQFNRTELMRCALVYERTLQFIKSIYLEFITNNARKIDFEVSIDETTIPTSPEAHYYIASQLKKMNVRVDSLAPRFCGEFQKGIDYIGGLDDFEHQFAVHAQIADHFDYRLSIHSGSDKFRVFPIIGKCTRLNVHVKTAGTNWLEAVRLIAVKNPKLYRKMHKFATANLNAARKYYRINAKTENVPNIDRLDDSSLSALMDKADSRQILHITYGLLLQEKDKEGKFVFRDEIYLTLYEYEDEYYGNLSKHIGKHLKGLGVVKNR